jgi:hypothetical protein
MTDLQIRYMNLLIARAHVSPSLAKSFALLNDVEEMESYLRFSPTQDAINRAADAGLDLFEVFR